MGSGGAVRCAVGDGVVRKGRAGVLNRGANLVRFSLAIGGLGVGVVARGLRVETFFPSSSSSLSSVMVGGRDCDASMPRVVLPDLGVDKGGRVGLVGEVNDGVATEGSRLCGEEKDGRWKER